MESCVEMMEKNLAIIDDGVAKLHLENEHL